MFSGVNKIVDRNFVVGFAMPSLILLLASMGIWNLFDVSPKFLQLTGAEPLKDGTILASLALSIAFVLMICNWNIMRILEGYWYADLDKRWRGFFVKRWQNGQAEIAALTARRDQCRAQGIEFPERLKRNKLIETFAQRFPSKLEQVLPTKFGNAIRALEDYPRAMYDFDSISGWNRLNAVIPKEYRELIDEARGEMNFWMNLWFITYIILLEYAILVLVHRAMPLSWFVVPLLVSSLFFLSEQTTKAGIAWGEWVKSAFDLYLIDLLKQLGYKPPANLEELRELCLKLSRVMIFRQTKPLAEIERFRESFKPEGGIPHEEDY